MSDLVRLSVSLEKQLLTKLDKVVSDCRFDNRSEFIRDLIRHKLVERAGQGNKIVIGTVTILFSESLHGLYDKIDSIFGDRDLKKLASTTVSIDENTFGQMILVTGRASEIYRFSENLSTIKGITQTSVSYNGLKTEVKD